MSNQQERELCFIQTLQYSEKMINDGDEMTDSLSPAGLPCGRQAGRKETCLRSHWKMILTKSRLDGI